MCDDCKQSDSELTARPRGVQYWRRGEGDGVNSGPAGRDKEGKFIGSRHNHASSCFANSKILKMSFVCV